MDLHEIGIGALVVAGVVTWAVTPAVIRLAGLLGAVDLPGGRKMHVDPMPRIGGVAVFAGFLAGLTFAAAASGNLFTLPRVTVYWRGLAVAATAMFAVGLADDLWRLSYRWKFLAQIVAATFTWYCGFRIEFVTHPLGGTLDLGWLSLPLTVLWIVAITNAVNLIDGLDGLAAGIALIITTTVAVISYKRGVLGVTAASVALAGSLLGFLRYNFNPARIFLGDSGSLFLGFVLAVTSIRGIQKGPTAVAILAPLLVLGVPLMDTSLAVARRVFWLGNEGRRSPSTNALAFMLRNSGRVFLPDRHHIHHRLIDLGASHRGAVLTLYGVATVFAVASFALVVVQSVLLAALLLGVLALLMAAFLLLLYVRRVRRNEDAAPHAGEGGSEPLAPAATQGPR